MKRKFIHTKVAKRIVAELVARKKLAVRGEDYSTNNAWGFGGSYGREWLLPAGQTLRIGTACFRHLPSRKTAYLLIPV